MDENIPGPSLTLVPELTAGDFLRLLDNPTKEAIDYWILKGERSVWPAVTALKIRCAIEVELDRGYQLVRRRKPFDPAPIHGSGLRKSGNRGEVPFMPGHEGEARGAEARTRLTRAASLGGSEVPL